MAHQKSKEYITLSWRFEAIVILVKSIVFDSLFAFLLISKAGFKN